MKRLLILVVAAVLALGVVGATTAHDDSDRNAFKAKLGGYQEVPGISTTGKGEVRLKVNDAGTAIDYQLTYSALQGGAAAQAHIHFAQPGVSGAVLAFLCGGGGKPACPAFGVTLTGTIVAADIQAIQGIAAGDLVAALRALRAGMTYANVHTASFPAGEIRGQFRAKGKND